MTSYDFLPACWANLDSYGIAELVPRLSPRIVGNYVTVDCPQCGCRQSVFIYANPTGPNLFCNHRNRCKYNVKMYQYVLAEHGGNVRDTLQAIGKAAGIDPATHQALPQQHRSAATQHVYEPSTPPQDIDSLQTLYTSALPDSWAMQYLSERGISLEVAQAAGMGYAKDFVYIKKSGEKSASRFRVTYPIRNQSGVIVAIEGRALRQHKDEPKSIAYGPKNLGVFLPTGVFYAKELHITEGWADALALRLIGCNAVAQCYSDAFPEWLPKALHYQIVMLCQDADDAGDKGAGKFAAALPEGISAATSVRLRPFDKDWATTYETRGLDGLRAAYNAVRHGLPDHTALRADWFSICAKIDTLLHQECTAKADRATCLAYVHAEIERFALRCDVLRNGVPVGFTDPDDDFLPSPEDATQLLSLRSALKEAEQLRFPLYEIRVSEYRASSTEPVLVKRR